MRKIIDVLRLKFEAGLSHERVAAATKISKGAVTKYVQRARDAGLGWPLPPDVDEARLEALLFPHAAPVVERYAAPDFAHLHQELKRKGVTLQLLWEEYAEAHAGQAYRYSQFCLHYHRFAQSLKRSMRQVHRAGDKLFIDYSGHTVPIINPGTGEIRDAEIFVAVLGASSYTYAEATWSQQLPDWIASHVRCFEFMGCVAALLVPDNLKSAIKLACRYEPEATSTYEDLARHYATAILPARPFHPRDKPAVEASVLLVQRWILARLRHRQFFSLEALNAAIGELLVILNHRPFQKLDGCRRSVFETIERPAMTPLPATRYEFAEWKKVIVNIDYHVDVTGHYYSVPHSLVRQKVEARFTATAVECFFKGNRVAVHVRSSLRGRHTTVAEHMPEAHRKHMQWTPGRLLNWALDIGPATRDVVKWQLENRPHPEQGYRACLGLLNLAQHCGKERLEAACQRALAIGSPTRKSIKSILEAKLDAHPELFPAVDQPPAATPPTHGNVRGAEYFRSTSPGETSTHARPTHPRYVESAQALRYGPAALSEQLTQSAAMGLAFDERLALLLDREVVHRDNRRLARLLQLAQLKQRACIEDIDYRARRGLDRSQLTSLASCDWIRQAQNLLIHGATGCGKTFLACALAQQACRQGLSALYLRAPRLFDELSVCHADGSFRKRLAAIAKVNLVLIDDFAIAPMGARERTDLLELLDDRVGTRSTLITSQLPVEHWHDYLGDPTLADAILDRLVHSAHKLHLEGESMRKRTAASTDKTPANKKKFDAA